MAGIVDYSSDLETKERIVKMLEEARDSTTTYQRELLILQVVQTIILLAIPLVIWFK